MAGPTIQEFDELRKEFVKTTEFGVFYDKFLQNFGEHPAFMELGSPLIAPHLERIINETTDRMLGHAAEVQAARLVIIPEAQLIHGAFFVESSFGGLLYFEDLRMGMVVITFTSGRCEFARFTLNPPEGSTVQ